MAARGGEGVWVVVYDFDPDPRYLVNVNRAPGEGGETKQGQVPKGGEPTTWLQGPHVVVLHDLGKAYSL